MMQVIRPDKFLELPVAADNHSTFEGYQFKMPPKSVKLFGGISVCIATSLFLANVPGEIILIAPDLIIF